MSRFIGDHKDFRKPGEPRQLVVTVDLLQELGVKGSPRAEQERAVGEWLRSNQPPAVLAASLRADGFLLAEGADEAGAVSNIRQTNRAKRARTGTDDGN